MNLYLARGAI